MCDLQCIEVRANLHYFSIFEYQNKTYYIKGGGKRNDVNLVNTFKSSLPAHVYAKV